MQITDETWEIIKNNDKNFDNKLWYGVATTKIFCRPSCVSRLPKRENVSIIPIPIYLLNEILDLLNRNIITIEDINNKIAISN